MSECLFVSLTQRGKGKASVFYICFFSLSIFSFFFSPSAHPPEKLFTRKQRNPLSHSVAVAVAFSTLTVASSTSTEISQSLCQAGANGG